MVTTSSYETAGPVALVMTTTTTEVDPELENRLVVLGVDESPEQTRAIVVAQRDAASEAGLFLRERGRPCGTTNRTDALEPRCPAIWPMPATSNSQATRLDASLLYEIRASSFCRTGGAVS